MIKNISANINNNINLFIIIDTKWLPWSFFIILVWGWVGFQVEGYNYERYDDNGEHRNTLYWKNQVVTLPISKMWNRPG